MSPTPRCVCCMAHNNDDNGNSNIYKNFTQKNENNKREIHQKKKCYRIWAVTTTELALYYHQLNNKKKKKINKQEFVSFKSDTPQRKEEKGHRHTNQFEMNILMHL